MRSICDFVSGCFVWLALVVCVRVCVAGLACDLVVCQSLVCVFCWTACFD